MLEVIGIILSITLCGAALVAAVAAAGAAALFIGGLLAVLACIGWIPILACAFYEHYEIGGDTFTGQLALASMWLYMALSAAILIIGFTVELVLLDIIEFCVYAFVLVCSQFDPTCAPRIARFLRRKQDCCQAAKRNFLLIADARLQESRSGEERHQEIGEKHA